MYGCLDWLFGKTRNRDSTELVKVMDFDLLDPLHLNTVTSFTPVRSAAHANRRNGSSRFRV